MKLCVEFISVPVNSVTYLCCILTFTNMVMVRNFQSVSDTVSIIKSRTIGTYRWANNLLNYEFTVPDSLAMRTDPYETASVISYLPESPSFRNLLLSAFLFCFIYRYVHQQHFTRPLTSYYCVVTGFFITLFN